VTASEIRIGSRGSALALAQAGLVAGALDRAGVASRVVIVETHGDRRAPDTAWGEGAFVTAIEQALLAGEVDAAVHSAKDVPTDEDPRLTIAAYLPRADPRDALVVRAGSTPQRLDDLQPGSRVGTDSPRRTGFLLALRPDLAIHPLHGNVDTRLRRLDAGETDALVLACAGLDRLGLGHRISERFAAEVVPPAPGQGAIAVQVRGDDQETLERTALIDDRETRLAVEAERSFLTASGGGCRAPIGALATIVDEAIDLLGGHASPDGTAVAISRRRGPVAERQEVARGLASELGWRGSSPIGFRHTQFTSGPAFPRVLVTRAAEQAGELSTELRKLGLDPVPVPSIAVEFEPQRSDLDAAAGLLHTYAWVVITSANGARAILSAAERVFAPLAAPRWAAIGPATRETLEREGIEIDFEPGRSTAISLAAELPLKDRDIVLVVRGDLGGDDLAVALRARGAEVDDVIAYRTGEAPEGSRSLLRLSMDQPIAAVVFTSGSTVRGLVGLGRAESIDVVSIPAVCIGPETAADARAAGFRVLAVSPLPTATALASTTARALAALPVEVS